ncbi:hypothetical protein Tco_0041087 [Tanacetum coccineum]
MSSSSMPSGIKVIPNQGYQSSIPMEGILIEKKMISSSRSKRGLEKILKFSIGTSSSENDSSSLEVQSSSISKRGLEKVTSDSWENHLQTGHNPSDWLEASSGIHLG